MAKKKKQEQPADKHPRLYNAGHFGTILNERPPKMSYEEYVMERRVQTKRLKSRLTGFMVWKSKCISILNARGEAVPGGESWGTLVGPVPTVRIR